MPDSLGGAACGSTDRVVENANIAQAKIDDLLRTTDSAFQALKGRANSTNKEGLRSEMEILAGIRVEHDALVAAFEDPATSSAESEHSTKASENSTGEQSEEHMAGEGTGRWSLFCHIIEGQMTKGFLPSAKKIQLFFQKNFSKKFSYQLRSLRPQERGSILAVY